MTPPPAPPILAFNLDVLLAELVKIRATCNPPLAVEVLRERTFSSRKR